MGPMALSSVKKNKIKKADSLFKVVWVVCKRNPKTKTTKKIEKNRKKPF